MNEDLTFEVVELQPCTSDHNRPLPLIPSGSPHPIHNVSTTSTATQHIPRTMATSTDAAFVEDVDVDQQLRARANKSSVPLYIPTGAEAHLPETNSDSDSEDAPLLSPASDEYGSIHGNLDGTEEEWDGAKDFRGLPWWQRPSVCLRHVSQ